MLRFIEGGKKWNEGGGRYVMDGIFFFYSLFLSNPTYPTVMKLPRLAWQTRACMHIYHALFLPFLFSFYLSKLKKRSLFFTERSLCPGATSSLHSQPPGWPGCVACALRQPNRRLRRRRARARRALAGGGPAALDTLYAQLSAKPPHLEAAAS